MRFLHSAPAICHRRDGLGELPNAQPLAIPPSAGDQQQATPTLPGRTATSDIYTSTSVHSSTGRPSDSVRARAPITHARCTTQEKRASDGAASRSARCLSYVSRVPPPVDVAGSPLWSRASALRSRCLLFIFSLVTWMRFHLLRLAGMFLRNPGCEWAKDNILCSCANCFQI